MKVINLTNLDKSEIKYKISEFPDGQQNITIKNFEFKHIVQSEFALYLKEHVTIKSRLNDFLDLELIICAVKSLRALGVEQIHLYVPYFVGARSDRQFEEGSNRYLADVICPIINSLNFKSVSVLDAHSYVLGNLLNGFKSINNLKLVEFSFQEILLGNKFERAAGEIALPDYNDFILVSPDSGATHKIYKLAEQIGYKGDVITCSKERDAEGKLTKTVVPSKLYNDEQYENKDLIIIDDICDGGRTFINIAKVIKEEYKHKGKLYLIVTHGIFSAGFKELTKYFDGIYCTNSYKNVPELEWDGDKKDIPTKVKQLDIF